MHLRKSQSATLILSILLSSAGVSFSAPVRAGTEKTACLSGQDSPQVTKLRKLTAANPKDQPLRVQLAEGLAKCNLHEQAIENFRQAYWMEPKSIFGRRAAAALKTYGEPLKDQAEIDAEQLKAASVRQMVEQIRKQTDADKDRIIKEGYQVASTPSRRSARFRFPAMYDFFGGYYYNARSSSANLKRQLAARRALALEESAANLESQLLDPPLDGVRLNATGTNLYVRNYEHTPRAVAEIPEIIPIMGIAKKWVPPRQPKAARKNKGNR